MFKWLLLFGVGYWVYWRYFAAPPRLDDRPPHYFNEQPKKAQKNGDFADYEEVED